MKRHFIGSFAVLGLLLAATLGTAQAADMTVKAPPPPPPMTNWSGFYFGVNGGWAQGNTDHTDSFAVTTGQFRQNGGLIGGTYGANWQFGKFVIGFEGDFDAADINGTLTSAAMCSVSGGTTCFTKMKDFGTDRIRIGGDLNGWLLYGTAGIGYGDTNAGQNPCALTVFGGFSCREQLRSGWVAGGGVEKMFAPHWSAKIEYLHYDFGNKVNYVPNTGVNPVSVLERGDIIRAGVNYKFDWLRTPVVAKY